MNSPEMDENKILVPQNHWENRCSICLEYVTHNKYITNCNHEYHESCLNIWAKDHNSCPVCRKPIDSTKPVRKCRIHTEQEDREFAYQLAQENLYIDEDRIAVMRAVLNSLRREQQRERRERLLICLHCNSNPCQCDMEPLI